MHALVRFAHIAAASTFTTQKIYPYALEALGTSSDKYSLASLRYDLSKLRAKGLTLKVAKSRRHRLTTEGYSVCLVFLKLFEVVRPRVVPLRRTFGAGQIQRGSG